MRANFIGLPSGVVKCLKIRLWRRLHNSVNVLKTAESYMRTGRVLCYMNSIFKDQQVTHGRTTETPPVCVPAQACRGQSCNPSNFYH